MQKEKTNIVLCGFMSSGKTTIGKPLAKALGYTFVDTDRLLVSTFGKTIPQMFAEGGEPYFRDREHEPAGPPAGQEQHQGRLIPHVLLPDRGLQKIRLLHAGKSRQREGGGRDDHEFFVRFLVFFSTILRSTIT